jgi:hypothetical protein
MSLPKLTKCRRKMLTAIYGWEFVSRMLKENRTALRVLLRTIVRAEIATITPPMASWPHSLGTISPERSGAHSPRAPDSPWIQEHENRTLA